MLAGKMDTTGAGIGSPPFTSDVSLKFVDRQLQSFHLVIRRKAKKPKQNVLIRRVPFVGELLTTGFTEWCPLSSFRNVSRDMYGFNKYAVTEG